MVTLTRALSALLLLAAVAAATASNAGPAAAADRPAIRVASTTSTEASGLFAHLVPAFEARTGIRVHVVAVGTGQAINLARRGDADVLLVHHRPSEEAFVADGYGVRRHAVMYNDFVVVGVRADPAGVAAAAGPARAFARIAAARAPFVSRADDSGTHKREMRLWRAAGIDPRRDAAGAAAWYREIGGGMGRALNTAAAMGAYTLSDRGTWLAFNNKRGLVVLLAGDPSLHNPYGAILVNPARFPHVREAEGQAFIDWLLSPEGQARIASHRIAGEQLFFGAAGQ